MESNQDKNLERRIPNCILITDGSRESDSARKLLTQKGVNFYESHEKSRVEERVYPTYFVRDRVFIGFEEIKRSIYTNQYF